MVKRKANKGKKYFKKSIFNVDDTNDISTKFNENDINDEIDEFHDSENKILLSKSSPFERKSRKKEEVDSVYDVEESSDDEDDYNEKINNLQNKMNSIKSNADDGDAFNDYKTNLKSWGKKSSNFYGGENEMQIDSDVDENEKNVAELEEEESMFLQKQHQLQLDDQDYDLDAIFKKPVISDDLVETLIQPSNTVDLSKTEKIKLVERTSPELRGIFKELKKQLKYISKNLVPLIDIYPELKHLQNKLRLYLNYCIGLSFYLVLKSNHEDVQNHPILTTLKDYYLAIQNLKEIEKKYDPETYLDIVLAFQKSFNKKSRWDNLDKQLGNEELSKTELFEEQEGLNDETIDRRAINYTISKNKGLTPRRKKENRNPRVKHRNKYRRALIRRKGQVRPVRKELNKYDGEISGIKMGVIKSRK